jgi:hypothetical protein
MQTDFRIPRTWRALIGAPGGGYEESVSRGAVYKRRMWYGKEMLTCRQTAFQLGITTHTVNYRRRNRKLLGLDLEGEVGYRYPDWQFDDKVLSSLPYVLSVMDGIGPWGMYLFLVQPEGLLEGLSPLQLLKRSNEKEVIRVVKLLRAAGEL